MSRLSNKNNVDLPTPRLLDRITPIGNWLKPAIVMAIISTAALGIAITVAG